ncbi:hypothetical protein KEM54_004113 [Ascosphaera aggregata]|nr:hypothetical protein KEM54_004113 [Ascosphaera aggregata]
MSASKLEADIIFDRANVALARSQKLVASWLPPPSGSEEEARQKTDAELRREEEEVFVAVPEKLGLGAPVPSPNADAITKRTELSSNEKLRQQLMGKNYKKVLAQAKFNQHAKSSAEGTISTSKGTCINDGRDHDDDDDDDEPSRTSLGKKKRQKVQEDVPVAPDSASNQSRASRRRGTSYLDEVLAQRAKKKTKKQVESK